MPDTLMTDTQNPEKQRFCGKKGRSGAPFGNKNRTRHGLRASGLPKGCTYIEGQISAFKRYIHEEMGELSLWQEATLQSACRHETRALLAARWLRLEAKGLSISERVALIKCISDATDARDRALKSIGLDRDAAGNIINALYHEPDEDGNGRAKTPS